MFNIYMLYVYYICVRVLVVYVVNFNELQDESCVLFNEPENFCCNSIQESCLKVNLSPPRRACPFFQGFMFNRFYLLCYFIIFYYAFNTPLPLFNINSYSHLCVIFHSYLKLYLHTEFIAARCRTTKKSWKNRGDI